MSIVVEGPSQFLKTEGGWVSRIGSAVLFFGDRNSNVDTLRKLIPDIQFNSLKQVHSDRVVMASEPAQGAVEADAHFTKNKFLALAINTADCLPILISNGTMVAAIHAGWRGLEASIVEKTITEMRAMGAKPNDFKAAIGPHIGKDSFEVGRDVADRLLSVYRKLAYNPRPLGFPHADESKRYVDLSVLAEAQLIQAGVPEKQITVIREDTFKNEDFHSYRRNKDSAGRQISFIVLR